MRAAALIPLVFFFATALLVATRLLVLWRRTRQLPEFAIGMGVVLVTVIGLPLSVAGRLPQTVGTPFGDAVFGVGLVFVSAGITLFFGAILSTPAQATGVGWLSGMVMAGLGGCWWPLEITPEWLQTAGHIFPTAWMMDALHELVSFGKGLDAVVPEMLILLVYGLVFGLLGARFLKIQA